MYFVFDLFRLVSIGFLSWATSIIELTTHHMFISGAWNQFDSVSPRSPQVRNNQSSTNLLEARHEVVWGLRWPSEQSKSPVFCSLIVCMCATRPDLSMTKAPACYNWFPRCEAWSTAKRMPRNIFLFLPVAFSLARHVAFLRSELLLASV